MSDQYAARGVDIPYPDFRTMVNAPAIAFDMETTGLHAVNSSPIGFSFTDSENYAYYADIDNQFLKDLMSKPDLLLIAHNASFDRTHAKHLGLELDNWFCTMVAAHLLWEQPLDLKYLAYKHTDTTVQSYSDLGGKLHNLSFAEQADYSCPDAMGAYALYEIFSKMLAQYGMEHVFYDLEMPLLPVLSDMEYNGAQLDISLLEQLGIEFDDQIETLHNALRAATGHPDTNFNSPMQAGPIFYNELGVPENWAKNKDGAPSFEGKWLKQFKDRIPLLQLYLSFKEYQKLKGTYVDGLLTKMFDGRIYGRFNQARASTGRLSSSDPNLQNIPNRTEIGRRIRQAFIPRPGCVLIKADAEQLELKGAAMKSGDVALLDAFRNNRDIHLETAMRMYNDAKRRAEGKTGNFKIIYGGGTKQERELLIKAYPGYFAWRDNVLKEIRSNCYAKTHYGRIKRFFEYKYGTAYEQREADKEAISVLIQGSSAEWVKAGMIETWRAIRNSPVKMILQVHDEVVFEVPYHYIMDTIDIIREKMTYRELELPITYSVGIGNNWASCKEFYKNSEFVDDYRDIITKAIAEKAGV